MASKDRANLRPYEHKYKHFVEFFLTHLGAEADIKITNNNHNQRMNERITLLKNNNNYYYYYYHYY